MAIDDISAKQYKEGFERFKNRIESLPDQLKRITPKKIRKAPTCFLAKLEADLDALIYGEYGGAVFYELNYKEYQVLELKSDINATTEYGILPLKYPPLNVYRLRAKQIIEEYASIRLDYEDDLSVKQMDLLNNRMSEFIEWSNTILDTNFTIDVLPRKASCCFFSYNSFSSPIIRAYDLDMKLYAIDTHDGLGYREVITGLPLDPKHSEGPFGYIHYNKLYEVPTYQMEADIAKLRGNQQALDYYMKFIFVLLCCQREMEKQDFKNAGIYSYGTEIMDVLKR